MEPGVAGEVACPIPEARGWGATSVLSSTLTVAFDSSRLTVTVS